MHGIAPTMLARVRPGDAWRRPYTLVLHFHEQYVVHALPVTQTGTRVFACWTIQNELYCALKFGIVLSSDRKGGKDHHMDILSNRYNDRPEF